LRVRRVVKVGILTRDLDATIRSYMELGGIAPWLVFELGPGRLERVKVGGGAASFSASVAIGRIGDVVFELIAPKEGQSPYHELLARRGEGVASVGVQPGAEGMDGLLAHTIARGYATLIRGPLVGDHDSAYLACRSGIGTDLELVDADGPGLYRRLLALTPDRVVTG
jgi:hypothetical protein